MEGRGREGREGEMEGRGREGREGEMEGRERRTGRETGWKGWKGGKGSEGRRRVYLQGRSWEDVEMVANDINFPYDSSVIDEIL
eukprot:766446-Hanusia_phi.AAC.3